MKRTSKTTNSGKSAANAKHLNADGAKGRNPLSQPFKYLRENVFDWKQSDLRGFKDDDSARSIRRMERSRGPFSLRAPSLASVITRFKESREKLPIVKKELLQKVLDEARCDDLEDYLLQGYSDSDLKQSPFAYVAVQRRRRRGALDKAGYEFLSRVDALFVGRERELAELDQAWASPETGVLCIVGFGGEGKTSLVVNWQRTRDLKGARFFAYSFYNQGASKNKHIAAETFVDYALREWFGVSEPHASAWRRGQSLAERIRSEPTLLILDGLEPLQIGTEPHVNLNDDGVAGLLFALAERNSGLCICTSRLPFNDLQKSTNFKIGSLDLQNLSDEDGAEYLRRLGVKGLGDERQQASREFGNHALALTLLGKYLKKACKGDVRRKDTIPNLADEPEHGKHARRVLRAYELLLAGKAELSIMRVLGLFDRPADPGALQHLRTAAVTGLTAKTIQHSSHKWNFCLNELCKLRLIQYATSDGDIDCHPLVRVHFAELLRKESQGTIWQEAHYQLCNYYECQAKHLPETLPEMVPLYNAVVHACRAGYYGRAWSTYWNRVQRGHPVYYNTNALGAFQPGLAMLSAFYREPWSTVGDNVRASLDGGDYRKLLEEVGFHLRGVCRFDEAAEVMTAAEKEYIAAGDFCHAAVNAESISETLMLDGQLEKGLQYLTAALHIDKCDDSFRRMSTLTGTGEILHRLGRYQAAQNVFVEAEVIRQRDFPKRQSVRSLYYLDLLTDLHLDGVFDDLAGKFRRLLDENSAKLFTGVYFLFLGRARTRRIVEGKLSDESDAHQSLNSAIRLIDSSNAQYFQTRPLCVRARLFIYLSRFDEAKADLDKALAIAERSRLILYEADIHLALCELYLRQKLYDKARSALQTGRSIVQSRAYRLQEDWCTVLSEALDNVKPEQTNLH